MSDQTTNSHTEQDTPAVDSKMSLKQKLRIVFFTLLTILLIIFIVQNSNRVEVEFLNMNFRVRIIFIILISALIGAILSFLLTKHRAARKRRK